MNTDTTSDVLSQELLQSLIDLFGRHPGYRPVHAKGIMCAGTFTPAPEARALTRAPHIQRESVPVVVRFSDFAGVPTIPDNDPDGSGPRGFAIRFYLAEHSHTDIVGHSHDGFPVRTGEDFVGFAQALAASGPDAAKPTPLDLFLEKHPETKHFVSVPNPIPASFANESFFGVNAFKFVSDGTTRFGRYKIQPDEKADYLSDSEAAAKSPNFLFDELKERIAGQPVKFHIVVQIAGANDKVDDATVQWPAEREHIKFGTFTLTSVIPDDDEEKRRIIFDPIPRVDGLEPSDDPLIDVRAAVYLMSGRRRRAESAKS